VILVNTCAIRDHAEQRVIGRLGELKRHMKPDTVMGVTGCMAQRLGPTLLEKARHVSLVIGPDGYRACRHSSTGATRRARHLDRRSISRSTTRISRRGGSIASRRGSRCSAAATIAARTASSRRRAAPSGAAASTDVVREVEGVVAEG
jgi:tRNA-2-methylthio-N6-dimethylallyladenosine synthase